MRRHACTHTHSITHVSRHGQLPRLLYSRRLHRESCALEKVAVSEAPARACGACSLCVLPHRVQTRPEAGKRIHLFLFFFFEGKGRGGAEGASCSAPVAPCGVGGRAESRRVELLGASRRAESGACGVAPRRAARCQSSCGVGGVRSRAASKYGRAASRCCMSVASCAESRRVELLGVSRRAGRGMSLANDLSSWRVQFLKARGDAVLTGQPMPALPGWHPQALMQGILHYHKTRNEELSRGRHQRFFVRVR